MRRILSTFGGSIWEPYSRTKEYGTIFW